MTNAAARLKITQKYEVRYLTQTSYKAKDGSRKEIVTEHHLHIWLNEAGQVFVSRRDPNTYEYSSAVLTFEYLDGESREGFEESVIKRYAKYDAEVGRLY